jgi:outer membrane protein assembly factor BamB
MFSDTHQGYNPYETTLNTSNVSSLVLKWKVAMKGDLPAEPVVVNGVLYEGSVGGYMYAVNITTHTKIWRTFLGTETSSTCTHYNRGIAGAAAVENGTVYVGGGKSSTGYNFYALDALTGNIKWQQRLGTSGTTNDMIWNAPAVANGRVYIGVASLCDKPLTQGMLYALDMTTGNILAQFAVVPNGSIGGGIWSVPTIDAATGTVIVTTGSIDKTNAIGMTASIVTLDWNTLAVKEYWQVPKAERIADADWGCTPTLFPGPSGKTYVGCINKNSTYYVFDEANVANGPIWQVNLGPGGHTGGVTGSFGSASYVNGVLYVPTALATVNGTSYGGSIGAFDALTGNQLWRFGTAGSVVNSVITANGLLFDSQGKTMEIRDMSTGTVLFSYTPSATHPIQGIVTVVNGIVYVPDNDGYLYVLGLP